MKRLARQIALAAIALVLFAALIPSAHAQDLGHDGHYQRCALPPGWEEIEALDPRYVVFGEGHGTREAPAFIEALVCALAIRGERVLLAVEHSPYYNAAWQEAWQLPPDQFEDAIIEHGWRGRQDGVGSEAMFELVRSAQRLRAEGASVSIVAFNGAFGDEQRARFADLPGQGPHEAAQAENIAEAAGAGDYDWVIVLVGGLHAETRTVVGLGPPFEPMAVRLADYGDVVALGMEHAGGSSWSCQLTPGIEPQPGEPIRDEQIRCQEHPSRRTADIEGEPFVALGVAPGSRRGDRHDGYFWIGPISASPPAVPQ